LIVGLWVWVVGVWVVGVWVVLVTLLVMICDLRCVELDPYDGPVSVDGLAPACVSQVSIEEIERVT
jgi:hypothetical protein